MTTRRLLLGALPVIALSVALVSLAVTAWSAPRDRASAAKPTGPATDAAGRARADLAARLGTTADKITVDSVAEQTWSDASLGLPEPDMMYAQVVTSGHVVTLSLGGRSYVYHVAGETAKLKPQNEQSAAEPPAAPGADPAERAKADLAARLGTTVDKIVVESVEEHTWSDTSLGLPEPGMVYAQVLTDGHIVTLGYDGRTYVYHVTDQALKLKPDAS